METIIGGVIGLVLVLLGMTLSNGLGLLLGFLGGAIIRLILITLQWECIYVIGITGLILFPSLIEANPVVLLGVLVGSFALEPVNAGMKYITNESGSLEIGERIKLETLTTDGRVPTHIYAYYGFLIIPVLGIILVLGQSDTFAVFKSAAFGLSIVMNLCIWGIEVWKKKEESNLKGIIQLIIGVGLSIGITFMSVATYQGSGGLSIYTVILPLVLLGLPLGKKSVLKHEVLADCSLKKEPMHTENINTCLMLGFFNSFLIITSQRQCTKALNNDPYDQYGIEAVSTYIQFALYFMLGWGKSGETIVMKVIESYQSLDMVFIILLMVMLWAVLCTILMKTSEIMGFLIKYKKGHLLKVGGEILCIIMAVLIVLSSPHQSLGLFMLMLCGLGNVLMRHNIIPSESMMGALLLPYLSFIK